MTRTKPAAKLSNLISGAKLRAIADKLERDVAGEVAALRHLADLADGVRAVAVKAKRAKAKKAKPTKVARNVAKKKAKKVARKATRRSAAKKPGRSL